MRRLLGPALAMAALVAGGVGLACGSPSTRVVTARSRGSMVESNVTRADYAGTQACAPCHASLVEAFLRSPMHRMTRRVDDTDVAAPFAGAKIELAGGSVSAFESEGRKYMRLSSDDKGESLYRITKVIGGRTREDFVGAKVASTDPEAAESDDERVMPVSFLSFEKAWRYKGYSVMVTERDKLHVGTTWKKTCIFCHNTVPLLDGLYDDIAPTQTTYQGSVSDNFLPMNRTWRVAVKNADLLKSAIGSELDAIGGRRPDGPIRDQLDRAMVETRDRFGEKNVVELGVGCESCHLGSREHIADPSIHPTFEPRGAGIALEPPAGKKATHATEINRACARCHTVLFSGYPFTWEGGTRAHDAGGSHINSGEARDFLLGACAADLACSTCHDVHAGSSRENLDRLGTTEGNGTCTGCHEKMASPEGEKAHTHHAPKSEGSACLACHMPKKNVGLRYELTRYHRIASPTDEAKVYGDRPLECALCHTDWSVERALSEMEKGWGKTYDRERVRSLYHALDGNVLQETIDQGKPHEAVAAGAALIDRGSEERFDQASSLLRNPYPLIRLFISHALEKRTKRAVPVE